MEWRQIKILTDDEADSTAASATAVKMDLLDAMMAESDTIEHQVTRLFEMLRMPVYQYLMAVFGNAAEAEDLTQDAFLQLYKALRNGQTIRNIRILAFPCRA